MTTVDFDQQTVCCLARFTVYVDVTQFTVQYSRGNMDVMLQLNALSTLTAVQVDD